MLFLSWHRKTPRGPRDPILGCFHFGPVLHYLLKFESYAAHIGKGNLKVSFIFWTSINLWFRTWISIGPLCTLTKSYHPKTLEQKNGKKICLALCYAKTLCIFLLFLFPFLFSSLSARVKHTPQCFLFYQPTLACLFFLHGAIAVIAVNFRSCKYSIFHTAEQPCCTT